MDKLHILAVLSLLFPGVSLADPADLKDTSWRLVEIVSMNDTVDRPDDPRNYTLEFRADGRAAIKADCNNGTGSWTSNGSQLQFGVIAATRALCPPGSLSDKYLAQFQWVRSFVIEDGHLFLATMADGSIIEFEPAGKIAASVFGEEIRETDPDEVQEQVLTRLFDHYAAENEIAAEPQEIETFVERLQGSAAEDASTDDGGLTAEEAGQIASLRQEMARSMIVRWKINRALYEKYGGRIVYQQLGFEPLDAYRQFLEERQQDGDFAILDSSLDAGFWRYFTDDSIHDFLEPGGEDEARAFSIPPWERQN